MSRYAATTEVTSQKSRAEIERTLARYGADSFAYGWDAGQAMVGFHMHNRRMRFLLPLPNRNDPAFTHTPTRGTLRTPAAAEAAYEQAVRQSWRALALVIKAKLEAVEAGIVGFEQEFAMHMVLPDGRTVADHVVPAIETAYATGQVKPMLALE